MSDPYNTSLTPELADPDALYSDWRITGQNLRDAVLRILADDESESSEAIEGERKTATALSAGICDWFTEGFDTAGLKNAKALLDERSV
jgi:hypothetical protein